MEATQTTNGPTSEDDDLGQATFRELIAQLALTEDEQRNTTDSGRLATLVRREEAIVEALHRKGLELKGPENPQPSGLPMAASPAEYLTAN